MNRDQRSFELSRRSRITQLNRVNKGLGLPAASGQHTLERSGDHQDSNPSLKSYYFVTHLDPIGIVG